MSTAYGGFTAADAFDALVYGENHPSTVQFLASQVNSVVDTLTDAGRAFMERGRHLFDHYNSSAAMRFARDVMAGVKGSFETNRIVTLYELGGMQNANLLMQRWVMANPNVRTMYHAQKLDGYSDTYIDNHPGMVGEDHYDYRRVMDGQFVWNPDEETDWKSVQYLDTLVEGDRDLLTEEQGEIIRGWNAMDLLIALGKDDPTSPVGGML